MQNEAQLDWIECYYLKFYDDDTATPKDILTKNHPDDKHKSREPQGTQ